MLTKGTKDVKWTEENFTGVDKPVPAGEQHWYEKADFHSLGIPFCVRPKGGNRIWFSVFGNMEDKALEIKEASYGKFKNSRDVNRNAHYIGMYILEQMYVKNKRSSMEERIFNKLKTSTRLLHQQDTLRDFFKEFYDSYAKGGLDKDELCDRAVEISTEISDPKLKEWFIGYCDSLVENREVLRKAKDRLRKKEAYSKGIGLVESL
jgi:hypothetical protein